MMQTETKTNMKKYVCIRNHYIKRFARIFSRITLREKAIIYEPFISLYLIKLQNQM